MAIIVHKRTISDALICMKGLIELRAVCGCSVTRLAGTSRVSRTTIKKVDIGDAVRPEILFRLFTALIEIAPKKKALIGDLIRELGSVSNIAISSPAHSEGSDGELRLLISKIESLLKQSVGEITNDTLMTSVGRIEEILIDLENTREIRKRNSINIT